MDGLNEASVKAAFDRNLKTLLHKATRLLLHGSTLKESVRVKRIPRGLRILKEPTTGRNNEYFCNKWCEIMNKASIDLTVLVIDFVSKELGRTHQQITER